MTIVEAICNQLIQEATAVKDCTQTIEELLRQPDSQKVVDTFDEIRIDKVEHIQKLTVELVSQFYDIGEEQNDRNSKQGN